MTWLVWRQHRKQLLFGVAALLVLGAFFVAAGVPMHDRFEELGLPACLPEAMEAPVVVDTAEVFMLSPDPRQAEPEIALAAELGARGIVAINFMAADAAVAARQFADLCALAGRYGLLVSLEPLAMGATRIGHGVRLVDLLGAAGHESVLDELHTRGVHLEVCPTSNVHTGAATSIATHPITTLWRAGVSLSFHTDNRLMSQVTHSGEALALLRETALREADLLHMGQQAAAHSFLPEAARRQAAALLRQWEASRPA